MFDWFTKEIKVDVINSTKEMLTKIKILYSSRAEEIPSLAPGSRHRFKIKPPTASALVLSFEHASQKYTHQVDTYFEKGYTGELILTIINNNTIEVTDNIKL